MDTSEIYIKMSKEAKLKWKWQKGDFFAFFIEDKWIIDVFYAYWEEKDLLISPETYPLRAIKLKECVPLPRQDQLQEMADGDWWISFCDLSTWIESKQFSQLYWIPQKGCKLNSTEQLWLAFVMKEKWGKEWINGDWVKK